MRVADSGTRLFLDHHRRAGQRREC